MGGSKMINTKIKFKHLSFERICNGDYTARSPIGIFNLVDMCGYYIVDLNGSRVSREGGDLDLHNAQKLANHYLQNKISNWIVGINGMKDPPPCKECSGRSWSNNSWGL